MESQHLANICLWNMSEAETFESSENFQRMDDISGAGGDGEIDGVLAIAAARKTYKLYVHTPQFCGEDLVIR